MSTSIEADLSFVRERAVALADAMQIDIESIYKVLPHLKPTDTTNPLEIHQKEVSSKAISSFIDHTVLKPEATEKDIHQLCDEAKQNNFAAVCVNGCRVAYCKTQLEGSNVKIATVVGFPLGADDISIKQAATTLAIDSGAEEIDMVINIGKLKDKDYHYVHKDIAHVVKAAHNDRHHKKHTVKVIFETCLLTREEIVDAAILCVYSGADYVKTSTGFSKAGAKAEDVRLMKLTVGSSASVKASGGVRTHADALLMIQNGASRIGTSAGIDIVKGGNTTSATAY